MMDRRSFIQRTAAAVMGVVACVYAPVMAKSAPSVHSPAMAESPTSVYAALCREDGSLYVQLSEGDPWREASIDEESITLRSLAGEWHDCGLRPIIVIQED